MEEMQIWAKKGELPTFVGADPIGWNARLKNSLIYKHARCGNALVLLLEPKEPRYKLRQEQIETKSLINEVVTLMKKQEPKPRLDGSWKKVTFQKEAPNSCGLHYHSSKNNISELKHE
ncbi:hypothetical protein CR513_37616, partial [Mucuna pruriens]